MQKRDPKTKKYNPYEIPNNWYCPLMPNFMDESVNCANCGQLHIFGACYTSRHIHNDVGLGYPVCSECYNKEFEDVEDDD